MYTVAQQTPEQPKDLPGLIRWVPNITQWVKTELGKIASELAGDRTSVVFKPLYAAPTRIYPCMAVYADGVTWNPGSGEGIYRRNLANSAWVFVG